MAVNSGRLHPRGEILPIRLQLAHGPSRRPKHCQTMFRVPVSGPTDYTASLAIRLLGTRLGGTPKDGHRRIQPHIYGDRQVHKMDRSQASDSHYSSQGSQFHRGDIAPIWGA